MTYHSFKKWTFDDEVTDEVIAEVVAGLEYHWGLNNGEQYTPDVYMKMCAIDGCIHYIGRIIDAQARGENVDIKKLTEKSPESAKEIIRRVLAVLCRPQKRIEYHDPVFNEGCCYCLGKEWRECRFDRLCRTGNAAERKAI